MDTSLWIRPTRPADEAALTAMLARCSPDAVRRRFHGAVGASATAELRREANWSPTHRSWVAAARTVDRTVDRAADRAGSDGRRDGPRGEAYAEVHAAVHGVITLAWGRSRTVGEVEVAFLVEDGWTRHGIGRALFGAAVLEAAREGVPALLARVEGCNDGARRFLRAVAPGATTRFVGAAEFEMDLPVRPAAALATGLERWEAIA